MRAKWSQAAYQSLRASTYKARHGHTPLYTLFRPLFDSVMARLVARSKVLVAVNPDDDEQTLGWLVYEPRTPPVIHFVGIKPEFRGFAIGRALLESINVGAESSAIYTLGSALAPKAWTYVPYGLMP